MLECWAVVLQVVGSDIILPSKAMQDRQNKVGKDGDALVCVYGQSKNLLLGRCVPHHLEQPGRRGLLAFP
ncbi:hypothetical protein MHYP_G00154090 [Metynnis hypsauchen]